jgi:hypothetical protein
VGADLVQGGGEGRGVDDSEDRGLLARLRWVSDGRRRLGFAAHLDHQHGRREVPRRPRPDGALQPPARTERGDLAHVLLVELGRLGHVHLGDAVFQPERGVVSARQPARHRMAGPLREVLRTFAADQASQADMPRAECQPFPSVPRFQGLQVRRLGRGSVGLRQGLEHAHDGPTCRRRSVHNSPVLLASQQVMASRHQASSPLPRAGGV